MQWAGTIAATALVMIFSTVNLSARDTRAPEDEPGIGAVTTDRPVVLTTNPMIRLARERIEKEEEPAISAWKKTLERANKALEETYIPYCGNEYLRYYRTARDQAQVIRDLALVYRISGEERYARRAREIFRDWTGMFHESYDFPRSYPASEIPHAAGLVIGRTVLVFADAYALLFHEFPESEREGIENWFRKLVTPIKESLRLWETGEYRGMKPPFFDRQYFNNHLGACTLGIAAIGFALRDPDWISYAIGEESPAAREYGEVERHNIRNLYALINGAIFMPGDFGSGEPEDVWGAPPGDPSLEGAPPPLPGEIYDRYRVREGKGMHYVLFHLRMLTLMAEMTRNNVGLPHYNGPDFYHYVGKRGENLQVSYDLYADWFITMDPASVNNGYYVDAIGEGNDEESVEQNLNALALFELVRIRYPESERIPEALRARETDGERLAFDHETFAWTAGLLYGRELDSPQ